MAGIKLLALNTIIRTLEPGVRGTRDVPAVAPKTQTIVPSTLFFAKDAAERDELIGAGAVSTDAELFKTAKYDLTDKDESNDGKEAGNETDGSGSNPSTAPAPKAATTAPGTATAARTATATAANSAPKKAGAKDDPVG